MKKLYRSKGTVHPSPPLTPPASQQAISVDHYLAFLPAAILTLTVALSPQDKQVLAYLISCSCSSPSYSSCHFPGSSRTTKNTHHKSSSSSPAANTKSGDHAPLFNCNCFRCYMSYWVRWDSSPNRQLIHEIIDAFEDSLVTKKETASSTKSCKKDRRAKKVGSLTTTTTTTTSAIESTRPSELDSSESDTVGDDSNPSGGDVGDEVKREEGYDDEKGSVRKIVSFLGERIWGVWT